jgi:hypothetical protein
MKSFADSKVRMFIMLVTYLLKYGKINGIELHNLYILYHSLVICKHDIASSFGMCLYLVNRMKGKIKT